jgi:hypothetical protein
VTGAIGVTMGVGSGAIVGSGIGVIGTVSVGIGTGVHTGVIGTTGTGGTHGCALATDAAATIERRVRRRMRRFMAVSLGLRGVSRLLASPEESFAVRNRDRLSCEIVRRRKIAHLRR